MASSVRIIISGGGTGGHIFPAIAIADAIKAKAPEAEILFVGAKGRMEMERVPKAGYPIKGLWISGFQRSLSAQNLLFPLKLASSLFSAWRILRSFRPQVAVGVGGFASGPLLDVATRMGIPALIQEQNSYAGVTNRLLAKRVQTICVAYSGMERYFPQEKLILTGNPVRTEVLSRQISKAEAVSFFGLDPQKPVVLLFGGSLGALALNEAAAEASEWLKARPEVQVIWQTGKLYFDRFKETDAGRLPQVRIVPFLERMDMAYAAADLVICRAGALTISELCLIGKPAILVPSPFVAEDHQTKNARALADQEAAVMVKNSEAKANLWPEVFRLIDQPELRQNLAEKIKSLGKPDAAEDIAAEVLKLAGYIYAGPKTG
ncbi:MAG: undecaprenyldiphospho-muramoylpentapeptide beta-N-acetylglucosaminyltransferase [Haliscomenobacter sp.]|nr:undecaprenyldiphospho-muramoylpentapeptide beta-N-acetylglucosaminyltransferase [Haliscomenobacter sp.]MBK7475548.1 undecaprenyldiphospho-muramoylpentapeptide beta-N-acetylglucosaminyltransferase [Haliscomenobacter sp.]MBK8878847.1 undecaprenyldiphospho-muramoylpentapeptide beta-N-acetylglucosaminyltransferase [Haliscomenobacter sp.]